MTIAEHRSQDVSEYHARKLLEIGTDQLRDGKYELARESFDESIHVYPTAEGYTFRGWARSYSGEYNEAIDDCKRAIKIDPEFGNPYNDLGVYMMHLGRFEEAIPWLKRAKLATRYGPRHFPYLNLGNIYLLQNLQNQALDEFVQALDLDPGNEIANKAIASMEMAF